MKSRFAILSSMLLSLTGSAALAQGWDDSMEEAARTHAGAVQQTLQYHGAAGNGQRAATQRSALEQAMENLGPAYLNVPEPNAPRKKWRMVQDQNGQPTIIEDTRGAAPTYQGAFGNFNSVTQDDPNKLSPLTPEMLRVPQQGARATGEGMWEQTATPGFFGGLKPPTGPIEINQEDLKINNSALGPSWAKGQLKQMHHYVDGQEHHGAEDPNGFF